LQVVDVFNTVMPVFLLILMGLGAKLAGLFGDGAARGLSSFVFSFAVPALLFKAMVSLGVPPQPPWKLWGAFFGAIFSAWAVAIFMSFRVSGLAGAGGAAAAMGAGFGNTVVLGLPLGLAYFGNQALLPMGLILTIHLPLQWFAATLIRQWAEAGQALSLRELLTNLARDLAANPIVLALVAGSLWNLTGMGLHIIPDKVLTLLGQAAVPAALFATGMTLARFGIRGNLLPVFVLVAIKLLLLPTVAALLAFEVFGLKGIEASVVVLFAAMPTGVNAYLFAEHVKSAEAAVSGSVAAGTALSIFTLSGLLAWLG
jgi:predicted permease